MKNVRRIMAILLVVLLASNCFSSVHAASLAKAFGNGLFAEEKDSISIETSESDEAEESEESEEEDDTTGDETGDGTIGDDDGDGGDDTTGDDDGDDTTGGDGGDDTTGGDAGDNTTGDDDGDDTTGGDGGDDTTGDDDGDDTTGGDDGDDTTGGDGGDDTTGGDDGDDTTGGDAGDDSDYQGIKASDNSKYKYDGKPVYRYGDKEIILTAPMGYYIKATKDGEAKDEPITYELDPNETSITYYLQQNINGRLGNTEKYEYEYLYAPLPEVEKVEFVEANPGNIYGNTVYTNKNVEVKVTLEESIAPFENIKIYSNGGLVSSEYPSAECEKNSYTYYQNITITESPIKKSETTESVEELNWYVVWGDYSSAPTVKKIYLKEENSNNQGKPNKQAHGNDEEARELYGLVIDRKEPTGKIDTVRQEQGDYPNSIVGRFIVNDNYGIALVEYCWDMDNGGFKYKSTDKYTKEFQKLEKFSNHLGDAKNEFDGTNGIAVLPYGQSSLAEKNQHRLDIRVTDYAGNSTVLEPLRDGDGYDPHDPLVENINISSADGAWYNVTDYGIFSNGSVSIRAKVYDDPTEEMVSGLSVVKIGGVDAIPFLQGSENSDSVYLATFEGPYYNGDMRIYAKDNNGRETNKKFSEISRSTGEKNYSNLLILETAKPELQIKYGNENDYKVLTTPENATETKWYNKSDEGKSFVLTWQDIYNSGETDKASGLQKVYFEYVGNVLTEKTDIAQLNCMTPSEDEKEIVRECSEIYTIGEELVNGDYTFSGLAVDNANNAARVIDAYSFSVDLDVPRVSLDSITDSHYTENKYYVPEGESISLKIEASDIDSEDVSGTKIYSGLDRYEVYVNGQKNTQGKVVEGVNEISLTDTSDDIKVEIIVYDVAGNPSETIAFNVTKDNVAPTISEMSIEPIKATSGAEITSEDKDENVTNETSDVLRTKHGIYNNNKVRILATITDIGCGVKEAVLLYKSSSDETEIQREIMRKLDGKRNVFYADINMPEEGKYLEGFLRITADDYVGNSGSKQNIDGDKEIPLLLEKNKPVTDIIVQSAEEDSSEEAPEEEGTVPMTSVQSSIKIEVENEETSEKETQEWYSGFDEIEVLLKAQDQEAGLNEIKLLVDRLGFNPGKTIVEKDLKDVPLYVEQPGNTIRQNEQFLYHFSAEYISNLINSSIDMPENPSEEEPSEDNSEEPSENSSEEPSENSSEEASENNSEEPSEDDSEESSENSSEETTENSSEEPSEGYMNIAYHANEVTNNAGEKQESVLLAPISEGEYRLHYQVKDNAGNMTELTKTYFIDSFAPEIVSVSFTPADVYGKEKVGEDDMMDGPIEQPTETEYGYFFKKDFILTIAVSDGVAENHASAGLGDLMYRIVGAPKEYGGKGENTEWITATRGDSTDEYTLYTIKIEEGFKGYIYFEVKDLVGNTSGEKTMKGCVSDDDAPGISGKIEGGSTPYKDEAGNPLYTRKVTTSFSVDDLVAGVQNVTSIENSEKKGKVTDGPVTSFEEHGWKKGLENGGLVLGVSKQFTYETDDNNISVKVNARDNSNNDASEFTLKTFSIDMTKPVVNIQFREDDDSDLYYSADRIADIRIKERNFDANRMNAIITNTFGAVPSVGYTKLSKDEYVATITFGEGDYTFDYNGTDRANHAAQVNFAGGNEKKFYVDKTNPVITTNFDSFANAATDNNFNVDKVASIRIEEHNFSSELVNLIILKKEPGALHNADGFTNVTSTVLKDKVWTSNGDVHTMEFTLSDEAVYQIQISMTDLAGNAAESKVSPIFEIDKTAPVIVARNGVAVGADDVENVEVYPYTRAADPIPYVEFNDLNYAYMRYELVTYIPVEDEKGIIQMNPESMYAKSDEDKKGLISDKKFSLPEFSQDGVYALEIIAVDDAGNESLLNQNTYMRIVKKDVLAYIMDSDVDAGTGLYSFQYENGEPISKRPDNFMDLRVCVLTKLESPAEVVLRDTNGREYPTNAKVDLVNSIYGVQEYYFNVDSGFFKETFQDDTDIELFFTVKNEENRIDLGKMHIDNIIPECEMPKGFKPWHWYYGKEKRTITLTDINELLDVDACKVFDNGQEIEFLYSPERRTLEFTIDKGWHNIGLILTDVAGNSYNIQELRNIHVGFFWLWIIIASSVVTVAVTATGVVLFIRKRAHDAF